MAWVKLDDQARHHRKILSVGPVAAWIWVCGLMYCNSQKARDGFIPEAAVPVLYPVSNWRKESARLIAAGLWKRIDGGYVVHDYHDYQPTAEDGASLSEKRSAAGRMGAAKRWQGDSKPDGKPMANAMVAADGNGIARPDPVPIPSRPDLEISDPPTPATPGAEPVLVVPENHERSSKRRAKSDGARAIIDRVFAHYLVVRERHKPGSRTVKLKPQEIVRAEKLIAAGYSAEDLELACEGLFLSPHHLGSNNDGTEYLAFFHALSEKVIDGFIGAAAEVRDSKRPRPATEKRGPALSAEERAAAIRSLEDSLPPLFREVMGGNR